MREPHPQVGRGRRGRRRSPRGVRSLCPTPARSLTSPSGAFAASVLSFCMTAAARSDRRRARRQARYRRAGRWPWRTIPVSIGQDLAVTACANLRSTFAATIRSARQGSSFPFRGESSPRRRLHRLFRQSRARAVFRTRAWPAPHAPPWPPLISISMDRMRRVAADAAPPNDNRPSPSAWIISACATVSLSRCSARCVSFQTERSCRRFCSRSIRFNFSTRARHASTPG